MEPLEPKIRRLNNKIEDLHPEFRQQWPDHGIQAPDRLQHLQLLATPGRLVLDTTNPGRPKVWGKEPEWCASLA